MKQLVGEVVRIACVMLILATVWILGACTVASTPPPSSTPYASFTLTPTQFLLPTSLVTVQAPTLRRATPGATAINTLAPPTFPTPIPRPHQFDDVDASTLLGVLFPNLKFGPTLDAFVVNGDSQWMMWISSRAEGRFTQDAAPELAVIVANDAPRLSVDMTQRYAPWGSFLAIVRERGTKLEVVQRSYLFPTAISPLVFEVKLERVVDTDHDGQDELLVTTQLLRQGVSATAAFLYQWNDREFVPVWSAPVDEDNTTSFNQTEYFEYSSVISFVDLDGNGMDEIVVDGLRVDYARDAQGLADTDREIARRTDRRAFRWNGVAFVSDPVRVTPLPPFATRSP